MPKFSSPRLAVLTIALLASFSVVRRRRPPGQVRFPGQRGWTVADGVVTLTGSRRAKTSCPRGWRWPTASRRWNSGSPKGARADVYLQGRYGVPLLGTGDWQSVSLRFRAPRMDAGFNKVANAMMLEVRVGNEVRTNVVFDKPSEGARWDAEDFRGPIVIYVSEGAFALAQPAIRTGGLFAAHRASRVGRPDQREGPGRLRGARQGDVPLRRLRGLSPRSNLRAPP
jgi:hypothetical protein